MFEFHVKENILPQTLPILIQRNLREFHNIVIESMSVMRKEIYLSSIGCTSEILRLRILQ